MLKKLSTGAWFSLVAAIAGVVGLVGMIASNNIDSAYALKTIGSLITMAICGVVLCLASFWSPSKFGNHDFISTFGTVLAIWLFMSALGTMIGDRVLMIAGLFSYNSQNMVGWSVFYATVVGAVGYVLASVLLIVGSFLKNAK
ncbi:MAG: hypothetical protein ACSW8F_01720 [bacterium]